MTNSIHTVMLLCTGIPNVNCFVVLFGCTTTYIQHAYTSNSVPMNCRFFSILQHFCLPCKLLIFFCYCYSTVMNFTTQDFTYDEFHILPNWYGTQHGRGGLRGHRKAGNELQRGEKDQDDTDARTKHLARNCLKKSRCIVILCKGRDQKFPLLPHVYLI